MEHIAGADPGGQTCESGLLKRRRVNGEPYGGRRGASRDPGHGRTTTWPGAQAIG